MRSDRLVRVTVERDADRRPPRLSLLLQEETLKVAGIRDTSLRIQGCPAVSAGMAPRCDLCRVCGSLVTRSQADIQTTETLPHILAAGSRDQGVGRLLPPEASPWCVDTVFSPCPPHVAGPLCASLVSVCPHFLFSERRQSDWIRAQPYELTSITSLKTPTPNTVTSRDTGLGDLNIQISGTHRAALSGKTRGVEEAVLACMQGQGSCANALLAPLQPHVSPLATGGHAEGGGQRGRPAGREGQRPREGPPEVSGPEIAVSQRGDPDQEGPDVVLKGTERNGRGFVRKRDSRARHEAEKYEGARCVCGE